MIELLLKELYKDTFINGRGGYTCNIISGILGARWASAYEELFNNTKIKDGYWLIRPRIVNGNNNTQILAANAHALRQTMLCLFCEVEGL